MAKLVGYLRVSTAGQVKDGLGLPTQERLIRAWAKAHGHRRGCRTVAGAIAAVAEFGQADGDAGHRAEDLLDGVTGAARPLAVE